MMGFEGGEEERGFAEPSCGRMRLAMLVHSPKARVAGAPRDGCVEMKDDDEPDFGQFHMSAAVGRAIELTGAVVEREARKGCMTDDETVGRVPVISISSIREVETSFGKVAGE